MDPCDFLEPPENFEPPATLRNELRKQTTAAVVRRRRVRRMLSAGALAACYVAGLGTMRLWNQLQGNEAIAATASRPAEASRLERPTAPAAEDDAGAPELERIASLVPTSQRAELFFQAGDRYWQQTADVQSALRCYRLALEAGPEDAWNISVHDNWLLMALKQAKQKEKSHANADG